MHSCVNKCSCYIYNVRLSPALNGNTEIQWFEHSNVIEICDRITNIKFLHMTATCTCTCTCICRLQGNLHYDKISKT